MNGLAFIIEKLGAVVPSLPDLHLVDITQALADFMGAIRLWMTVFPFLWTIVLVMGIMVAFKLILIAWYWINWLINKIPFIG